MRHLPIALTFGVALLWPTAGSSRPNCAGPVEIERANIQRIDEHGAIVLTDHRTLHLEGIRLALGQLDRAPQTFATQAIAAILSLTKSVTVTALPPKKDRHGRIRAHVFAGDLWLQRELLSRGLARVEIAPDHVECAAALFAAETKARAGHAGLWTSPAYAIRTPLNVGRDIDTFQIVEGRVLNASVRNGRAYLNFGADWRNDFTAIVDPVDFPNFQATGVDPRSYAGQTIRVRGWVQLHNGPEIEVPNPQGIEVVQ